MLAQEWMTKDVMTISPDTSMMKASRLMKERMIRRLPVVNESGVIIGIISDRDIKAASPSKATTLEVHELYYLLSKLEAKDVMTKNPICAKKYDSVEGIAYLMSKHGFGGVPIIDDENKVCGIITDSDIFSIFLSSSGVMHGGIQVAFDFENPKDILPSVYEALSSCGATVISMLTSQKALLPHLWRVYIRLMPISKEEEERLVEKMREQFPLTYVEDGLSGV